MFWGLPLVDRGYLRRADMLHVVYLGMMKDLMDRLSQFLTSWGQMQQFDVLWKEMPHYPGFMLLTKEYSELFQWPRKEMRNFVHIVLPGLASALDNPPPA